MRKILFVILTIGLFQVSVHAQFFKNTIVKTRPYQDFIALNPTLGFEKPIGKVFSLELDLMYRNQVWNNSGNEGDFGRYYDGDGFRILLGSKVYFGKTNKNLDKETQKAPFGWFATLQTSYSVAKTYNIEREGFEKYYVNSYKNWGNINIGIGYQFYLFKTISLEIYAGPTIRTEYYEEFIVIEGFNPETEFESYRDTALNPFGTITLGYYIK